MALIPVVKNKGVFNALTGDYTSLQDEDAYKPKPKRKVVIKRKGDTEKKESNYFKDMSSKERNEAIYSMFQNLLTNPGAVDRAIYDYLPAGATEGSILPIQVLLSDYSRAPMGAREGGTFSITPFEDGQRISDFSRTGMKYGPEFYRYIMEDLPRLAAAKGKVPVFIGDVDSVVKKGNPDYTNLLYNNPGLPGMRVGDNKLSDYFGTDDIVKSRPRLANVLTAILNKSHDFSPLFAPEMQYQGKELTLAGRQAQAQGLDVSDPKYWKKSDVSIPMTLIDKNTGQKVKTYVPVARHYNSPLYNWNTALWRDNPDAFEQLASNKDYANNWESWGQADMFASDATGLPETHVLGENTYDERTENKALDYLSHYANLAASGRYFPEVTQQYGGPTEYAKALAKKYGIKFTRAGDKDLEDYSDIKANRRAHFIIKQADENQQGMSIGERKEASDKVAEQLTKNGLGSFKTKALKDDILGTTFTQKGQKARKYDRRNFVKNMFSDHDKNKPQLEYLKSLGLNPDEDISGMREWVSMGNPGYDLFEDLSSQYTGAALAKGLGEAYAQYKEANPDAIKGANKRSFIRRLFADKPAVDYLKSKGGSVDDDTFDKMISWVSNADTGGKSYDEFAGQYKDNELATKLIDAYNAYLDSPIQR